VGQREGMAYWKLPSFQPATVKGTSACGTRVALRGAPHDHRPRPVSTLLAQTICGEATDSGDTGTEEVAKKRFNPLLPCSSSPRTPLNTGVKRRKKRLSRSPRLLPASPYAQACESGDNGWELGGSTLPKGRTCTQVRGLIRSSRWIAVHSRLPSSFTRGRGYRVRTSSR